MTGAVPLNKGAVIRASKIGNVVGSRGGESGWQWLQEAASMLRWTVLSDDRAVGSCRRYHVISRGKRSVASMVWV